MKEYREDVSGGIRGASPWSRLERARMLLWECAWWLFCRWTPKPLWHWRNLWLRIFGAELGRSVFVHQRARISKPWNVHLGDRACVGDRAALYSLGTIEIGPLATVAQEVYLCTGTHDFTDPAFPLKVGPILVGAGAFIGVRAIILPGIVIGPHCIVGAGSVVTRDVPIGTVVAGNPARPLKKVADLGFQR